MGFLDKLKLGHKKDELDIPPPPPLDKKPVAAKDATTPDGDLPPLPSDLSAPTYPKPAELKLPTPSTPKPPVPEAAPRPPVPGSVPSQPRPVQPPLPSAAPRPPVPEPRSSEHPRPVPITQKVPARQDMRSTLSDIPPIKISAEKKSGGFITDDHVNDLDVDNLMLPGEKSEEATPTVPESVSRQPQAYEGPLYVDVKTYEDIQSTLKDLQKQLKDVNGDVDSIKKLTRDEDKQFAILVKKLEKIQDDVLRVDKDLFERK